MTLKVTVLGSAGMFATLERACSGYLLNIDGHHLWLDAGPGTWRHLLEHVDYQDLEGVMLSHRHPDHTTDVFQAYHARRYGSREPLPTIPLWAPQETLDALVAYAPKIEEAFDLHPVNAGDVLEWNGATFTYFAMAHPPTTVGVRVESNGAVFAYSADTGPDAAFEDLARDADLFICEATLQDSDAGWEGHLHASAAARVAAGCGVKRLILTHVPPGRDMTTSEQEARRDARGIEISIARDNETIEVGNGSK